MQIKGWLGVGLVVLALSATFLLILGRVRWYDRYVLVSCPLKYEWRVDGEALSKFTENLAKDRAVVYLACALNKTKEAVGSGELAPFIYASRGSFLGMPRVALYLDAPVWRQYDRAERTRLMGMMVVSQLAQLSGWDRTETQRLAGGAYYESGGVVWLEEQ